MAIQQRDPEREGFWRTAVTEQQVSSGRLKAARFPTMKTLEDFDFAA